MLNRAKILGAVLFLCSIGEMTSAAEETVENDDQSFICATPQITPFDTLQTLNGYKNFSAGDDGGIIFNSSNNSFLTSEDYSAALGEAIWKRSDSIYPGKSLPMTLGIAFLDDDRKIKDKVMKWASEWSGADNKIIKFEETSPQKAQIRITFKTQFNHTYLGRQAIKATNNNPTQPTMHLADVGNPSYSLQRWRTVVLHEFGHALGLRHEHLHPNSGIKWNENAIYEYHKGKPWGRCSDGNPSHCKEDIRNFITRPLSVSTHKLASYDEKSIMIYPILKNWTTNSYSVADPSSISGQDLSFIRSLYSKLYAQ